MANDRASIRTPLASLEAAIGFTNLDRDLDAYAQRVSAAVNANLNNHTTLKMIAKFGVGELARRATAPASRG